MKRVFGASYCHQPLAPPAPFVSVAVASKALDDGSQMVPDAGAITIGLLPPIAVTMRIARFDRTGRFKRIGEPVVVTASFKPDVDTAKGVEETNVNPPRQRRRTARGASSS